LHCITLYRHAPHRALFRIARRASANCSGSSISEKRHHIMASARHGGGINIAERSRASASAR